MISRGSTLQLFLAHLRIQLWNFEDTLVWRGCGLPLLAGLKNNKLDEWLD